MLNVHISKLTYSKQFGSKFKIVVAVGVSAGSLNDMYHLIQAFAAKKKFGIDLCEA